MKKDKSETINIPKRDYKMFPGGKKAAQRFNEELNTAHSGEELWDKVENIIDYYRVWGDDSTAKKQLKLKFNITKK